MNDSKQPGFWQTLPGVLTALAGVITAVAGLIVAFDQIRARSTRGPEAQQSRTTAQTPAASQAPAASRPPSASPASTIRAAESVLTVGPPGDVRFMGGDLVFSVRAARLQPFNQDTRLLNVSLRIVNNMKNFDRSYYTELRAIADELPQAPQDPPLEQIEAHSVKDLTYTFRVPADVRTLALRITRMEEAGDIPLGLK
jgi:hypothetical protein